MKTLKEYFKARLLSQLNEKDDYYQQMINDRNSQPTMGIDPGTREHILKGSPMDIESRGLLSVAKTYRKYYDDPKERLRDPLNLKNIKNLAADLPGGARGAQMKSTYDELNRRDRDKQLFGPEPWSPRPDPIA